MEHTGMKQWACQPTHTHLPAAKLARRNTACIITLVAVEALTMIAIPLVEPMCILSFVESWIQKLFYTLRKANILTNGVPVVYALLRVCRLDLYH